MFSFLSYSFMIYALLLGLFIAFAAALLSPFLVLSQQSLIADGMAHISFTGFVIGLIFANEPLYFALPFAVIAAITITFLTERVKLNSDASIGVVSTLSLAIGLVIIEKVDGFNRLIDSLLVGSILTIYPRSELVAAGILVIIVTVFVLVFYRQLLSATYDQTYAAFSKIKVQLLKYALSALTAVFVVLGVRAIGALLISAFVIFPTLIARQLSRSFNQTLVIGIVASLVSVMLGIFISYHLTLPTGPSIIIVFSALLALAYLTKITLLRKRI